MTAAIEDTPVQEEGTPVQAHEGCLVCTSAMPPLGAYRPHTLNTACWCTSPTRHSGRCQMTVMFGVTAE